MGDLRLSGDADGIQSMAATTSGIHHSLLQEWHLSQLHVFYFCVAIPCGISSRRAVLWMGQKVTPIRVSGPARSSGAGRVERQPRVCKKGHLQVPSQVRKAEGKHSP